MCGMKKMILLVLLHQFCYVKKKAIVNLFEGAKSLEYSFK